MRDMDELNPRGRARSSFEPPARLVEKTGRPRRNANQGTHDVDGSNSDCDFPLIHQRLPASRLDFGSSKPLNRIGPVVQRGPFLRTPNWWHAHLRGQLAVGRRSVLAVGNHPVPGGRKGASNRFGLVRSAPPYGLTNVFRSKSNRSESFLTFASSSDRSLYLAGTRSGLPRPRPFAPPAASDMPGIAREDQMRTVLVPLATPGFSELNIS